MSRKCGRYHQKRTHTFRTRILSGSVHENSIVEHFHCPRSSRSNFAAISVHCRALSSNCRIQCRILPLVVVCARHFRTTAEYESTKCGYRATGCDIPYREFTAISLRLIETTLRQCVCFLRPSFCEFRSDNMRLYDMYKWELRLPLFPSQVES